jgi:hypothetical protein
MNEIVNIAELTGSQWKEVSLTAQWLTRNNMSGVEYSMLERISQIRNESDYLSACDEYDNQGSDMTYTDLQAFYDTLDNVVDCALFGGAYALPQME